MFKLGSEDAAGRVQTIRLITRSEDKVNSMFLVREGRSACKNKGDVYLDEALLGFLYD